MTPKHRITSKLVFILTTTVVQYVMPLTVSAAECSVKSGETTVPLLELYTSEGCSSCPPADKWLSELKVDSHKFIPLAFHVDYWDYIGWKDKFAKIEFSDRQRKIASSAGVGFVYTPQFVLNGRDFRGLDESRLYQAISVKQKLAPRVNLSLNYSTQESGEITLQTTAKAADSGDIKKASIFVAIYENKLVSHVNAGENNGRELKHDYVVRDLFGTYKLNEKNEFVKRITLSSKWKGKLGGAVIFVQDSGSGETLQSLQLPFCS